MFLYKKFKELHKRACVSLWMCLNEPQMRENLIAMEEKIKIG